MSHIPNSAMPHAGTIEDDPAETEQGRSASFRKSASRVAGKVRERPKTAAAAGAALVAGLAAAVAVPLLRKSDNMGAKKTSRTRKTA